MKITAIVQREYRENRVLVPLGLLLGLLAFFWPLLMHRDARGLMDFRILVASLFGVGLAAVLGFMLGAGLLGPDVQEGRAGFFLARPLSPSTLLAGKLLGAFLLAALSGLAAVLPSFLWHRVPVGGQVPLGFALMTLAFILLGHAASIAFRDRSAWLLLDLMLILGLVGGAWHGSWRLKNLYAFPEWEILLLILGAGAFLALLGGAFAQAHWGRTDLRRGHRALALAAAAALLPTLGLGWAWVHRVEHPSLAQLRSDRNLTAGRRVPWSLLSLPRSGEPPMQVLANLESGSTLRVGPGPVVLAADGVRATGLEWPLWSEDSQKIWIADLGSGSATLRHTSIGIPGMWLFALDAAGTRLACVGKTVLEVHDLQRGTLLYRRQHQVDTHPGLATFVGPDLLRVYDFPPTGSTAPMAIHELDLARGRWTRTGQIEGPRAWPMERDQEGDLLVRTGSPGEGRCWELVDGRTGALRQVLPGTEGLPGTAWIFLSDGSLLGVEASRNGLLVRHLDPQGAEVWRASEESAAAGSEVPRVYPHLGLEAGPGVVPLYLESKAGNRSYLVDCGQRRLSRTPDQDGWPLPHLRAGDFASPWPAGTWAARLRTGKDGSLGLLQADGGFRAVVPGGKP